ncbi:hypothetical protein FACS189487_07880 [Campylobacterota bacterium]|nr:hypothetical protein FACS189487_07880 [Campylobacterota bacterium]
MATDDNNDDNNYDNNDVSRIFMRGVFASSRGDHEEAIADFTRAIETGIDSALACLPCSNPSVNPDDRKKAIENYIYSFHAMAYLCRGESYQELGEHAKAITDLTRAIEMDPNDNRAYYCRGRSYHELGEHAKAIADLTRAIKNDPFRAGSERAYYFRGNSYAKLGDHAKAITDFTQAIELDSFYTNYANAYYNRGISYGALGFHAKANEDFTQALTADGDWLLAPVIDETISEEFTQGNEIDPRNPLKAITDLTRMIEIDPNNNEAYVCRCKLYLALNDFKNATKDARKACELGDCVLFKLMDENGHICD